MIIENVLAVPPDGGWGWVILGVSFYGYMLTDVPTCNFQIVSPHLIELFKKKPSTVSLIFSTFALMAQISGPIAGGILNRYGFRSTVMTGCLLAIFGFVPLMFLSEYIAYMLLYGVVAGIGLSMIELASSVAPGFWFEKKRALAIGIVTSSTGVSVLSVSFMELYEEKAGWRYCFLMWAVLAAVLGLLSFLLRSPPMIELEISAPVESAPKQSITAMDVLNARGIQAIKRVESTYERGKRKVTLIPQHIGRPVRAESVRMPARYSRAESMPVGWKKVWRSCCECCYCRYFTIGSRPLYRKDIFYQGDFEYAKELQEVPAEAYTFEMSKLPTEKDVREEAECECWKVPEAITRAISEMFDFSLFKSGVFLLLVLSTFLFYMAYYIPILHLERVNKDKMDDAEARLVPLMMGLGLLIFRVSVGVILYAIPRISAMLVTVVSSIAGGIIFCIVPLGTQVPFQLVVAFLGGGFPAVFNPLRSVVIIEELGIDKLTSCMGMLFFVQGVASYIGLPMAEILVTKTDYPYAGILLSGILTICSGLAFSMIALLNKLKNRDILTASALDMDM